MRCHPNVKPLFSDTAISAISYLAITEDLPDAATSLHSTISGAHSPRLPVPHSHHRRLSVTFHRGYSSPSSISLYGFLLFMAQFYHTLVGTARGFCQQSIRPEKHCYPLSKKVLATFRRIIFIEKIFRGGLVE